jgi:hypothetical protein
MNSAKYSFTTRSAERASQRVEDHVIEKPEQALSDFIMAKSKSPILMDSSRLPG